jgi:hypothetical protein
VTCVVQELDHPSRGRCVWTAGDPELLRWSQLHPHPAREGEGVLHGWLVPRPHRSCRRAGSKTSIGHWEGLGPAATEDSIPAVSPALCRASPAARAHGEEDDLTLGHRECPKPLAPGSGCGHCEEDIQGYGSQTVMWRSVLVVTPRNWIKMQLPGAPPGTAERRDLELCI